MKKVHKLEIEDHGRYEYVWPACRDPERFNEGPDPGKKPFRPAWTYDWNAVTCKYCLKKRD